MILDVVQQELTKRCKATMLQGAGRGEGGSHGGRKSHLTVTSSLSLSPFPLGLRTESSPARIRVRPL